MNDILVLADIARIQDYILTPRRLKRNRGASQILHQYNTERLPDLVRTHGGRQIFANGGNFLGVLPAAHQQAFCREAERELRLATGTVVLRSATVDYPDPNTFANKFRELHSQMARVKASTPSSLLSPAMPFWSPCESCGLCAATTRSLYDSELVCHACHLREKASDRYEERLRGRRAIPDDFNQIGSKARPRGYLALVYLDLDGMGEYFNRYATDESRLAEISQRIDQSVTEAVDDAASRPELCEVLLVGGDDAAIMLPAHAALDFLEDFRTEFLRRYCEPLDSGNPLPDRPTFSAGVVFAHSHFPISEFFRIASRLQHSAKLLGGCDSVDYEIITTSLSGDPLENRERTARRGAGRLRTAKPYTLDDLLKRREVLRELKPILPANKIHSLYRMVYQGPEQARLDYLWLLSRLDQASASRLRRVVGPDIWSELPDGRVVTHAADFAELWEFV